MPLWRSTADPCPVIQLFLLWIIKIICYEFEAPAVWAYLIFALVVQFISVNGDEYLEIAVLMKFVRACLFLNSCAPCNH